MSLMLKVRVEAGDDINTVADQMHDLAGRTGIVIEAEFNGVWLRAYPDGTPFRLVRSYYQQVRRVIAPRLATSCDGGDSETEGEA